MTYIEHQSDAAFSIWLATFTPSDMSPVERTALRFYQQLNESLDKKAA